MITLDDIPAKHARLTPERECLACEGHRLTWRQLDERIDRLANGLRALGIAPGEHVAILSLNNHRYVELYYGAARAGLVVVPLNWRLPPEELAWVVEHSDAVALVSDGAMADAAAQVRALAPGLRGAISLDGPAAPGVTDYEELLQRSSPARHVGPRDEDAMCMLMYTGGTTGRPKGVMISHRNLLTAALGCALAGSIRPTDSTLMVLPLFHIALWPVVALHYVGGRVAVLPRLDLAEALETIQRERVTHINVVPTILTFLVGFPDVERFDLSSLRLLTYAGAPITLPLLLDVKQKFPALELSQGYGLTEAASLVSLLDADAHRDAGTELGLRRLRSAGREALTTAVRIVGLDGREAAPEMVGEVHARGANVALGYWKDPQLTASTLRDGWLCTGDLGYLDRDGFLFIVDRKNDLIITGGENVYPRQVEDVVAAHPAVQECAVIGAPDPVWGEAITAVVALRPGAEATAEELVAFCASRLAGYMKPKRVVFVDELPKTPVGKITRRAVRELVAPRRTSS
jgi:acyl-CoA synthetase (AMP-forming)/AMP-acid ligase II